MWGPNWRAHAGYQQLFDPDDCGHDHECPYGGDDPRKIPGKETRPLYDFYPRVHWGEWGPEVIEVPGSASGIYLDRTGSHCVFGRKGAVLGTHNMDHWGQVLLCLMPFTWFAHSITLEAEYRTEPTDGSKY